MKNALFIIELDLCCILFMLLLGTNFWAFSKNNNPPTFASRSPRIFQKSGHGGTGRITLRVTESRRKKDTGQRKGQNFNSIPFTGLDHQEKAFLLSVKIKEKHSDILEWTLTVLILIHIKFKDLSKWESTLSSEFWVQFQKMMAEKAPFRNNICRIFPKSGLSSNAQR